MQNLKSKFKIKLSKKTFYFLLVFLSFEFLFLSLDKADAAALSIGIDPTITTINAIPPTTITSSIKIQNRSDMEISLQMQIKPFKPRGENGELEYQNEALSILKYIEILDSDLPFEKLTLGPRQEKELTLNIKLPEDTYRSDYYFSIVFVSVNESSITNNTSLNQVGIATNILLSVGEKELPKGVLEEFSSPLFLNSEPVPFTLRIKNTSIHTIKPTGQIIIKNMFGQSIGKLNLSPVNILSNSIRAIPNDEYIKELVLKKEGVNAYKFQKPILLWKERFLLGLYSVTLNVALSDEGPYFNRTIHFLAFPLQGLIIIVLTIATIIIIRKRVKVYLNKTRT